MSALDAAVGPQCFDDDVLGGDLLVSTFYLCCYVTNLIIVNCMSTHALPHLSRLPFRAWPLGLGGRMSRPRASPLGFDDGATTVLFSWQLRYSRDGHGTWIPVFLDALFVSPMVFGIGLH
jgi:hypothetical protein